MARRPRSPRDPNSLVASAALLTGPGASAAPIKTETWQGELWGFFDEVPELQFGATWSANALSRVNIVAAVPPRAQGDEPTPIDLNAEGVTWTPSQRRAVELVASIAGGPAGQGQLLAACAVMLTLPGVGYIHVKAEGTIGVERYTQWRVCAPEEIREVQSTADTRTLEVTNCESGKWEPVGELDLVIKVWRSHPRRRHEPWSPARSCRKVLVEIVKIGDRVIADLDSRLAGNGLLIFPNEVEFPVGQVDAKVAEGADPFVSSFVQVAEIAYTDPRSPAARLPLVVKVPGEWVDKVRHVTFDSKPIEAAPALMAAAIRRLALGLDMPPEVLLGMGESNHWSAWQVAEEAITLHVEPLAESIVHAITIGFLNAALRGERLIATGDDLDVMVWYDTSDLTTRPDRGAAAGEAHSRTVITDDAYLTESGLDPSTSLLVPGTDEFRRRQLLAVASGAPTLAPMALYFAGVITKEEAAEWMAAAAMASAPPADAGAGPLPADATVDTQPQDRAIPEQESDQAALLAAADGLVARVLERAGNKLRNKVPAGRVTCDDPMLMHTHVTATEHCPLEVLLEGAWDRVPTIAARCGVSPVSLTAVLDAYTRTLLAVGHAHEYDRLAAALGVTGDRRELATASR